MKAVLPVAGAGTRLRPHTHTQPKALVHVAGKPILGHILDRLLPAGVDEVVLIVGQWGDRIADYVRRAYPRLRVSAVEQAEQKGLGHAVYMARQAVQPDEPVLIVLGDTIFQADLARAITGDKSAIGVRRVPNPSQFGVVEVEGGRVRRLVEKPAQPATDLAIVGIYYIRRAGVLFSCLDETISGDVRVKGEYQLTDGLQRMVERGEELGTFPVDDWWDCGNPATLLKTNRELLALANPPAPEIPGSIIIPPVAIEEGARIVRSVVGPYVSVAGGAELSDVIIRDSIVNEGAAVSSVLLDSSLVGHRAVVRGSFTRLNVGDSSSIQLGGAGDE
ncbi:MAG: NTP transferase domain-containing protein [Firmicutes bacterium]|nr:NTP transferase domain-containing protein [Bacillota bacterium]